MRRFSSGIESLFGGMASNWPRHPAGWSALPGCASALRKVLVLEPELPRGGGEAVLAVMGEDPDLATVPVMVLTSCRNPQVLDRVARFPVSEYHLKPLTPYRLAERLRTLLHHPRRRCSSASVFFCSWQVGPFVTAGGRVARPRQVETDRWAMPAKCRCNDK